MYYSLRNDAILWTFMLVLALPEAARAIVTSDEPGSHVVPAGESAFGLNLDGVGFLGWSAFGVDLPLCSGVLIGDRDVLTVAHCIIDGEGNNVLFDDSPFALDSVAAFDTPEGRMSIPLVAEQTHYFPDYLETFQDLAVLRLAEDAPPSIPRYPIYAGQSEVGQRIAVAGYGSTGIGPTGQHAGDFPDDPTDIVRRAGLNRIEAFGEWLTPPPDDDLGPLPAGILLVSDFDSGDAIHNFLAAGGIGSDLGFGSDEVAPASGDSGGPAFIGPAVAGIVLGAAAFGPTDVTPGAIDSSWGEATLYVRLSAYRDFLTTATEGRAVFVPEPPTWGIAVLLLGGVIIARCRNLRAAMLRSRV